MQPLKSPPLSKQPLESRLIALAIALAIKEGRERQQKSKTPQTISFSTDDQGQFKLF